MVVIRDGGYVFDNYKIIGRLEKTHIQIGSIRLEPGAIIYDDVEIGEGSIIGANAVLRPHTNIGHHTIFGTLSCSEGENKIGNYTTIHAQCHITKGVIIGDNVFIAPFFIATNTRSITRGRHGTEPSEEYNPLPLHIEDNVRIGANVRVTPGVTIGHDSLIDQDCLITRDIMPHSHVRARGKDHIGSARLGEIV